MEFLFQIFCLQICCHDNDTKFLIQILITPRDNYYTFNICYKNNFNNLFQYFFVLLKAIFKL